MSANIYNISFTFWNIKLVCMKCILPVSSQTKPLEEERERFFECDYPAAKTHIPSPHIHNYCKFKSCTFFLTKFCLRIKNHPFNLFFTICSTNRFDMKRSALSHFYRNHQFLRRKNTKFQREPQTQYVSMQSVWCCC